MVILVGIRAGISPACDARTGIRSAARKASWDTTWVGLVLERQPDQPRTGPDTDKRLCLSDVMTHKRYNGFATTGEG